MQDVQLEVIFNNLGGLTGAGQSTVPNNADMYGVILKKAGDSPDFVNSARGEMLLGVLVQRELDKSVSQLRDFFCLWQIVNPPLAGLSY